MMAFIDDMRSRNHAVESTCRALRKLGCRVAARTYRSWRQANRPVAARTVHDAQIVDACWPPGTLQKASTAAAR